MQSAASKCHSLNIFKTFDSRQVLPLSAESFIVTIQVNPSCNANRHDISSNRTYDYPAYVVAITKSGCVVMKKTLIEVA